MTVEHGAAGLLHAGGGPDLALPSLGVTGRSPATELGFIPFSAPGTQLVLQFCSILYE
jgi:hypothetical protein